MLNNNVVLARDEIGREAILTGRGLGFQRKRGQDVDASLISRRYILADNAQSVAEVIAGIPLERLAFIERVFRKAARGLNTDVPSSTLIAVVDHINQAMERVRQGLAMDYPLRAEVAHLHPEELQLAEAMVEEINAAQEVQLPLVKPLMRTPSTLRASRSTCATSWCAHAPRCRSRMVRPPWSLRPCASPTPMPTGWPGVSGICWRFA